MASSVLSPAFADGFKNSADPSSLSCELIRDLPGPLKRRSWSLLHPTGSSVASQKPALQWPFYLLSVCASFCQYLLITNTAISCAHAAPVHGGFLSRASWGCLSRLSNSSPASPFLCGCQPAHQWYFPECPHYTTGGMAPQFCFLSEIPRHRGMEGVGATSEKVLCCYCF